MEKMICYCHGYTQKDIEEDALRNGRSTIMEAIRVEARRGNCNCAEKNPSGR